MQTNMEGLFQRLYEYLMKKIHISVNDGSRKYYDFFEVGGFGKFCIRVTLFGTEYLI